MECWYQIPPKRHFKTIKQIPLFAQKRYFILWGTLFIFLDAPGSRPRSQYIFLIHNRQLSILFSLHKCAYCTIFSNYQSQNTPSNTPPNSSHFPLFPIYFPSSTALHPSPLPGAHFSLTKTLQNTPLYPLLHTPSNHLLFHQKYLKMA